MLQNLLRSIPFVFFLLYCYTASSQVTATIVKNIAPGSQSSDPAFLVMYNGEIYFRANDKVHGRELWKSDGTEAGTVMVKDIYPGSNGSEPENLAVSNGVLYFSATDGVNGAELWRSDGTAAGTQMVKDITPGNNTYPGYLIDVNGILYFTVDFSNPVVANRGLWKSNGTAAGTVLVAGTYSNSVSSGYIRPTNLTNVNGAIFFIGEWPSLPIGTTLWKSDGTTAGTVMVSTNTTRFPYGIAPSYLTALNNEIFFAAKIDTEGGGALWKSDGTEAGTVVVKDMNSSNVNGGVQFLTNINNTLYFAGNIDNANSELWKSDGMGAGTGLVKDIDPGSLGSQPFGFALHNGLIYFTANTVTYGREIWRTDGTAAGTVMVADLYPNAGSSVGLNPFFKVFISMNNDLYFIGTLDNGLGQELYKLTELPLPVVWEEVSIDCKEGLPHLYWKTAREKNTKDFIIQTSSDAANWVNADTIEASGNTNASVSYQYTGKQAAANTSYYRIIQRDRDGRINYSVIKTIACQNRGLNVSLFPNPANRSITLSGIEGKEIKQIEIFDVAGKRVFVSQKEQPDVDVSFLPKGLYFLQLISNDNQKYKLRFIRQ